LGCLQGCQILLDQIYQNGENIYKITTTLPNGHKIYQHFPFQGPPKFTQSGIWGFKIYHLATLDACRSARPALKKGEPVMAALHWYEQTFSSTFHSLTIPLLGMIFKMISPKNGRF
jgi:hypothetical protein